MRFIAVRQMRSGARRATALALIGALALFLVAPAGAAPRAKHVRIEIHDQFTDDFLSEACGMEVVVTDDASLNVTVVYNKAGLISKEIDPSGGGKTTFSAPATGRSFSFPFSTTIIDYGAGAEIGSRFIMKLVGMGGHVPGQIAADAGQLVLAGFVKGFDENGLPLLEVTDFILERGNRESGEDIVAAICAALT